MKICSETCVFACGTAPMTAFLSSVFSCAVRLRGQSAAEERSSLLRGQRESQTHYRVLLPAQLDSALLLHTPGVSDCHHRSAVHFTHLTQTYIKHIQSSGRMRLYSKISNNKKTPVSFFYLCIYPCVHPVCSQASRTTGMTWAIPSMLITVCWIPRPTSAGRSHRRTRTETTGETPLQSNKLQTRHHTHFCCSCITQVKHVFSATTISPRWSYVLLCFQCTSLPKWRFWRRGVYIHRNGCQNSHGKLLLLPGWTKIQISLLTLLSRADLLFSIKWRICMHASWVFYDLCLSSEPGAHYLLKAHWYDNNTLSTFGTS